MSRKHTHPVIHSVAESEILKSLQHEIRMEVEFYLSPDGLKADDNLAKIVNGSATHSAPVDFLLNYGRIKELKVNRSDFLEAISESEVVELDGEGTGVKPKKVPTLDELEPQPSKKVKADNIDKSLKDVKAFEPKLFKITLFDTNGNVNDADLKTKLQEQIGVEVVYLRLHGKSGYFAVDAAALTEEAKAKMAHANLKIDGMEAKVQACWDEDLDKFYQRHGRHMDAFLERKGKRRHLRTTKDEVDLVFYNKNYYSITPLIYIFDSILSKNSSKSPQAINKADHQLLFELVTYHDNFDAIVKDLDHFIVDKHPTDPAGKCFYAVKKDGSRVNFTTEECLDTIIEKYFKVREKLQAH